MKKLSCAVVVLILALSFLAVSASVDANEEYEESGFRYQVRDKEAIVTASMSKEEKLVVPEKLGGFPVTGIGMYAFQKAKYTDITLPDTVKRIEGGAFFKVKKLVSISFPRDLTYLGSGAFQGCTGLTEVRFNSKLKAINGRAFSNCIALKEIVLPDSVKSIRYYAFEKCYKLGSVKFSDKLTNIGNGAFYKNYALKTIRIPSTVKKVGENAFGKCESLANVQFDNEKTKLGNKVFYMCVSLKKAVLPKGIKMISESTFEGCEKLKNVVVPEDVSIIKRRAFYNCKALKGITLNSGIYAIGDQAFAYSGLAKLKLNSNMQFIGNGAFEKTSLKKLTLTSKVKFIGNRVFADCDKLQKIVIPKNIQGINPGAFNNCVSLREIKVSAGNKSYCSEAGVLYDKNKTKLIQYPLHKTSKSFRTPYGLKRIRSNAFAGNPYLREVTVSADSIGNYSFNKMERLKSVQLLNGIKKIGVGAFRDNSALQSVTLPDSVTYIGSRAFENSAIKRIHIPSRLGSLENGVFDNCNKLVAFDGGYGVKYTVKDGVLYNRAVTRLIKYPSKRPAKVFTAPDSVKKVKWGAFTNVSLLTKLEFGENLQSLGYRAVYKAKRLKSVVFHSGKLLTVSAYSVADCSKLAVIVGPDTYSMRRLADRANATLITL